MRPTLLTTNATHLRMRRAAEYELMERAVGVVNLDAKKPVTVLSGSSFIPEVFSAVSEFERFS